jgi:heme exporter protein D
MIWSSWQEFVAMGGYGYYVWGSFGMAAALMAAEVLALRRRRAALRDLAVLDPGDFAEYGGANP